ncbi:MAG: ArsC/Spx/MgsR family protein [Ilumatobacteraceae bacterium]
MADVTIYHNTQCNSSGNAVNIANELGVEFDTVLYLKTPPDEETLRKIIGKLEDPVTDLVRRDSLWTRLGLTDADVQTEDQVVAVLLKHKQLMQRPVVVTKKKAIIGRPKERVRELLGG